MQTNQNQIFYQNNFKINSHKRLFSLLMGENKSLLNGNGLDFKELRGYNANDDVRRINWKITAKKNEPCLNVFNEDKKLNIFLVYLISGGIYFGSARSKKDTMDEIFANLYFAALNKKDAVGTIFFSIYEEYFAKPSQSKSSLKRDLHKLSQIKPIGTKIDFKALETYLMNSIKTKSLIFMIGDFLDDVDFKFLGARHEIYSILVRDKLEEDLAFFGDYNIIDLNSNKTTDYFLSQNIIKKYNQKVKEHDRKIFEQFKKQKIKSVKIYTHENILVGLSKLLREK